MVGLEDKLLARAALDTVALFALAANQTGPPRFRNDPMAFLASVTIMIRTNAA